MFGKIREFFSNDWKISGALAALALILYMPTMRHGFLPLQDPEFVSENWRVMSGLSPNNIRWAATTTYGGQWTPVLWLSWMTDVTLLGGYAWAFHLTNTLLHAANVVLLFLFLRQATGQRWASAAVAALFAAHPLNVEAVAWISARGELLGLFFALLGLWAYDGYTRRPSTPRLAAVAACMTLAMMSKPEMAIFPLLLLCLDYWPYGRWRESRAGLISEKMPLFILAAVFYLIAVSVRGPSLIPWAQRVIRVFPGYAAYLVRIIWPSALSIFHPAAEFPRLWLGAAALWALIAAGMWATRRSAPFLITGALWFLAMLLPVVDGVRISPQGLVERFAYGAGIGVFIAGVWAVAEAARRRSALRPAVGALAAAVVVAATARSMAQVRVWREPTRLFEQAASRSGHFLPMLALGAEYQRAGRMDEALATFEQAARVAPNEPLPKTQYAEALAARGEVDRAMELAREALELNPRFHPAANLLGLLFQRKGEFAAALACFEEAARLAPDNAVYLNNLGVVHAHLGRMAEAARYFEEALKWAPHRDDIRANYERALMESQ